jgi:patatin-like phospholipase/acyl hydrolase
LDGGGLMGAFSVGALSAFEEISHQVTGKSLAEQFDLITGTSTGGITAVGLGMGGTIGQILKLYRDRGTRIFPRGSGVEGWLPEFFRSLFGRRYTSDELRQAIEELVRTATLGEARARLVIPAYDTTMGRVYIFKTPHVPPDDRRDADKRAVDVALATSAAPTYFPAHPIFARGIFIDGGVWANCPAMVDVVEAIEFCKQRLEDLRLLSISTTNYPFRLSDHQQRGGLIGWGPKILETFMFGQVQNAVAEATCRHVRQKSRWKCRSRGRDFLAFVDRLR